MSESKDKEIRAFMVRVEPDHIEDNKEFILKSDMSWAKLIGRGATGTDWGYKYLGNHKFFFVCDDMGLLKNPEDQIFGAYGDDYHPIERRYYKKGEERQLWGILEGNIIIMSAQTYGLGYTKDLTDEEIELIKSHLRIVVSSECPEPHAVLVGFNYTPLDEEDNEVDCNNEDDDDKEE